MSQSLSLNQRLLWAIIRPASRTSISSPTAYSQRWMSASKKPKAVQNNNGNSVSFGSPELDDWIKRMASQQPPKETGDGSSKNHGEQQREMSSHHIAESEKMQSLQTVIDNHPTRIPQEIRDETYRQNFLEQKQAQPQRKMRKTTSKKDSALLESKQDQGNDSENIPFVDMPKKSVISKARSPSTTSTTIAKQSKPSPPSRNTAKMEPWQIQKAALKTKFGEGWNPRKKLSPDAQDGIRNLHVQDPERYSTSVLAQQFEVSPEAIRRILKSRWQSQQPPEKMQERRERWAKRHDRIWDQQSELGLRPKRTKAMKLEDPDEFEQEIERKSILEASRRA